ncbi:hypothetical protein J132_00066 [Termitomyces sp. J132]|nr:hypothetical protein H2248_007943 [Termitomyces sp. 'cryptogamus']KAH0586731.1 hypothetical protein H2248_007945 [Termitomyces sp. 'cryptogamus']KNZ71293.1 hypothetical protein J132_00066 [Termitomyces sp. J132]
MLEGIRALKSITLTILLSLEYLSMRFSSLFVVSAFAFSALALPAGDFSPQIILLSDNVEAATTAANGFTGTVVTLQPFQDRAQALIQATKNAKNVLAQYPVTVKFTLTESSANLEASKKWVNNFSQLVTALVNKKNLFEKIAGGTMTVHKDITDIAPLALAVVEGLFVRTPDEHIASAKKLRDQAIADFTRLSVAFP